jgi:DNA-binding transcriptional LysR family regulator
MNKINTFNIDLNLLVLFVTLWETRNVTRAGERLSLSQSAVSHGLRRLRDRLGEELFVYGREGLLPTPRASELIVPIREALEKIDQALQGGGRFIPEITQRKFRIAASDYVEFAILPKLIEQISRVAPGVVLQMQPLPPPNTGQIQNMLESGEVDLAIDVNSLAGSGLRCEHLVAIPLVTLVWQREGLPSGPVPLDLYLERPHVVIGMQSYGGSVIDQALTAKGQKRRIGAVVQNFMAMPAIAAQTGYLCNLPSPLALAFVDVFNLSCHATPIAFPEPEAKLYWHNRFDEDESLQWLRIQMHGCVDQTPLSKP